MTSDYSTLSHLLTKKISKVDKKNNGIYFTPPSTIQLNLKLLDPYIKTGTNVLEPSCGSCEYIHALNTRFDNLKIIGIELNDIIYDGIKHFSKQNVSIICQDYLTYSPSAKYGLIIGNPPYFVMKKADVDNMYYEYFDGRPNIFVLFIIKSITLLEENGILSFILPNNFLNCLYYDKTRKYINKYCNILHIVECNDDYIETKQPTILLIIQKTMNTPDNDGYILRRNGYVIFGTETNIIELKLLYDKSNNLSNLQFDVNVGTVVWNQCKSILTDDTTKTRLIYSSDVLNNELVVKKYTNIDKKNYINKPGVTKPLLVINRGYGKGVYNFQYCLIKGGFEYLIENHLICINYSGVITDVALSILYEKIITSLNDPRTKRFIKLYFGNNAINTTELKYILPIYDI